MKSDDLGVRAIGVRSLPTDRVKPNPHNPRYLFDEPDMSVLRESIRRVGILVPLTVYQESKSGSYVILDGQRRWICAQKLGLKSIPVNLVQEPTLVQNIVTMFQIHKLRKDWELMPTALKIELLMKEIGDSNDRRFAELTGLDEAVVVRCKKLLSYPKKYQNLMLDPDPKKRVKADFFIELYAVRNAREVNKFDWYSKDKFTEAMLKKFENGTFRSVTDFRTVKQFINNASKAKRLTTLSKRLREFQDQVDIDIQHLNIRSAAIDASARKILKNINGIYDQIDEIDTEQYFGEEALWDRLAALSVLIQTKLKALGRRAQQ